MLPHLYQIRGFAQFRVALDALKKDTASLDHAALQARVNALPFEIPEYNCVIGLWGQTEARVAYDILCGFCREHGLIAPERKAMRYVFKRRLYDALCTKQRGLDHPLWVGPEFYEAGAAFGMDTTREMMRELCDEGVLMLHEDGRMALANWSDFRFDFNI